MKHSDNRVLAVWGSPSCGKTTIAAKIAGYIADKGFDVALLLCDTDAPPLPLLASPSDIETEKSLGSILAAARITENLVMQNAITFKKNKHIVAFGLMKGENSFSYPKYTQVQAKELTKQITPLRKELKVALRIEEHIPRIKELLDAERNIELKHNSLVKKKERGYER